MTSKIINRKSKKSKQIIIAVIFQMFFTASLFGQKYENGTRLLKSEWIKNATIRPLREDEHPVLEDLLYETAVPVQCD